MTTDQNLPSINKFRSMFEEFKKKLPPLREALDELGLRKDDVEFFSSTAKAKAEEIRKLHKLTLTDDEIGAIFVYSSSMTEDYKKPYDYINEALSSANKEEEVKKVRKYLALLLSGLRKLPREYPSLYVLYRGLDIAVPLPPEKKDDNGISGGVEDDSATKGYNVARGRAAITPYLKGVDKTWWSFTSTTAVMAKARDFTKRKIQKDLNGKQIVDPRDPRNASIINGEDQQDGNKPRDVGTLFIITMAWGYDISIFSEHSREKEYLLEPERRFTVEGVLPTQDGPTITVRFNSTDPLVLEDIFPPKYTKPVQTELPINDKVSPPEDIMITGSWCNGAAFYWSGTNIKGIDSKDEGVVYQVGLREKVLGKIFGEIVPMNTTPDIPTEDNPFMVGPLKPNMTYRAYVRVGTYEYYSPWSKSCVTFKTPKIERVEGVEATNPTCDSVSIKWNEVSFCPQYHIKYEVWFKDFKDPKPKFERASTAESIPFVHDLCDVKDMDAHFEYRVRALIDSQTEKGESFSGDWSNVVSGGPIPNIAVKDFKCEYSKDTESIELSWSAVTPPSPMVAISYVVTCHNTFKPMYIYNGRETSCSFKDFEFGGTYAFFIRVKQDQTLGINTQKPDATITVPERNPFPGEFKEKLNNGKKVYALHQENPRLASFTMTNDPNAVAVVLGNTVIPFDRPSTWNIRIQNVTGPIFFGIAPVSIRSTTTTKSMIKYGWYINPMGGTTLIGIESARTNMSTIAKFKHKEFGWVQSFPGTGGLMPGDVVTLAFNPSPSELSLRCSYNNQPMNGGSPIFFGIDPSVITLPAVLLTNTGSVVEIF